MGVRISRKAATLWGYRASLGKDSWELYQIVNDFKTHSFGQGRSGVWVASCGHTVGKRVWVPERMAWKGSRKRT